MTKLIQHNLARHNNNMDSYTDFVFSGIEATHNAMFICFTVGIGFAVLGTIMVMAGVA